MSFRSAAGAAIAVALAAAAGAAIAPAAVPSVTHPTARVVAVTSAALGCPQAPEPAATTVLAVAPQSSSAAATGALRLLRLPPAGASRASAQPATTSADPGLLRHSVPPGSAVLVSASAALAPGAAAALVAASSSPHAAGLATGWCQQAAAAWQFDGVSTSVGATSLLTLTNPTPTAAVVDVQLLGPRGPVDALGARGIAVPPRTQHTVDLAGLAPGVNPLSVHVTAEQGTVSAAVYTFQRAGLKAVGTDWVARAAPAATGFVVGPAVGSTGHQRLVLTNPGGREALASIQVFDALGAFTPTKLTHLRVPPGTVVATDLSAIFGGRAAAVAVSSNVALTGAITTVEHRPIPDFTTVGVPVPLTTPSVVPLPPRTTPELLLTASDRLGTSVRIETVDSNGHLVHRQRVTVRGRATTSWRLPHGVTGAYLVISPGSHSTRHGSGVQGVAYFRGRYGLAALPLVSGSWSVRLPVVQPAP